MDILRNGYQKSERRDIQMKSKSEKTIFQSGLVIIGFVFNKGISFLMIPILTRILTTDDYGRISTYAAWMALLAYVIGMALEYSIRNAFVDYKNSMDAYMSALCGLSLAGAVVIGAITFFGNKFFAHQMNDVLCLCCIVHAYVHALVNYANMYFTMYEQHIKRVLILVLPNLLSSVLGVVLILQMSEEKYMGRIWGYVLVFLPLGIFLLADTYRKGKIFYKPDYWKYALIISVPMIFHGLSNVVLSNFDRILLSTIRNDSEAGIYSLVYNFSMIAIAVTTAIESIWIPWFTRRMEEHSIKAINLYVNIYIYAVVVVICGILMIAPEVLMLMAAREYWGGKTLIVPIVLSSFMIFLYSNYIAVELYYKANRCIALNTLAAAAFNLFTDILLIPKFGMMGAAYTTLASYALLFFLHYRYSRRLNRELYPFRIYFIPLALVTVMSVVSYLCLDNWLLRWGIACILGLLSITALLKREKILLAITDKLEGSESW